MKSILRHLHALAIVCSLLGVLDARAQPTEGSDAERLFHEGVELAEAGNYVAACEKFGKSLQLVPRASTLLNLAVCEAEQGKLVSAHARYKAGIALLPPEDPRLADAEKEMGALDERIPRLTLQLAPDAPAETTVRVDGNSVALETLTLDPGPHEIVVAAPGHEELRLRITLGERERKTELVSPGTAGASPDAGGEVEPPTPDEPDQGGIDPLLPTGIALAGVGVVGIVVGAVVGAMTLSDVSAAEEDPALCPNKVCSPEGRVIIDDARATGIGATIALAAGGLAVAGGVALIVVSMMGDDDAEPALVPLVGPHEAGVVLTLGF